MHPLPHQRRRSPHAVSVAELLCRYDTVPAVPLPRVGTDPSEPVPVSALLRREGRARRALDRPLVPRGHSRPAPVAVEPPRLGVRKAAAAAGALFVVGAVFGAGVLEEALLRPDAGADPADGLAEDGPAGAGSGVDGGRAAAPGVALAATAAPLPVVTGADIGAAALAPASLVPVAIPVPRSGIPSAGSPGAVVPVAPGPVASGPAAPGPVAPGPGTGEPAGPVPPPPGGPGASGPDGPGAGPAGPRPIAEVPDLGTPAVEVPAVVLPSTPLGPVATPSVTVTEAAVVTPDVVLAVDGDGVGVGTTDTALVSPDAALGALDAGPVGLSGTGATLGDLEIEGTEVLRVGPEPEVTVPAVTLTPTALETPDVRLGEAVVEVPDLALPEVSTPEVPVVETVTGLLDGPSDGGGSAVEDVPLVGSLLG